MIDNIPDFFRRYNGCDRKGNYEFYCQEFAYSIIYGNIKLANIEKIMELLMLDTLPRIMFLVRVDDYQDIYKTFPEFRVYPLKVNILNKIQKYFEIHNISAVVASFLGRDTLGVFLCIEGDNINKEESRKSIGNIAEKLIEYVQNESNESISIGISNFCDDINRFPKAYSESKDALNNNFRIGKGTYSFYGDAEPLYVSLNKSDVDTFTSRIVLAIDKLDKKEFENAINEMINYLSSTNTSWVDIRLHMVKLVDHISDYYINFGFEKKTIDFLSINAMKEAINSNFIVNVEKPIYHFCNEIFNLVEARTRTSDEKFKIFVDECMKNFYSDNDFNMMKVAELYHYSPYHFGKLFKKTFSISFNQYLNNYRIEKAKILLAQSQMSIESIAFQVGFATASYFCIMFKKIEGITPRQYTEKL